MSDEQERLRKPKPSDLRPEVEGRDFVIEEGLFVLTRAFLLRRGYCCGSGCRHCPYPSRERALAAEKSRPACE